MKKIGRNTPCPCGSGKKYKRCCLSGKKSKKSLSSDSTTHFTPVYTDIDNLSNSVVDLIKKGKLNEAEEVCRRLLTEYPDQIDGLDRLAQVYEARGDKSKACEYYNKAADFARTNPGFDKESVNWYLAEVERIKTEF